MIFMINNKEDLATLYINRLVFIIKIAVIYGLWKYRNNLKNKKRVND